MDDLDLRSLNVISLCTGGGGLDRAVELAIPNARPVACVEREAFAVANLVAQMQQRVMAEAPIHGDVRTFPGRRFRGVVDFVIGGIPCQPYSLAGKRLGRDDERDLWGPARRIWVASGAWGILIENVGGMLSEGGAERVRRDLHRLGCTVAGGLFRASEVGFAQERERLFILGIHDGRMADATRQRGGAGLRQGGSLGNGHGAAGAGGLLAHTERDRRGERPEGVQERDAEPRRCGEGHADHGALADADVTGSQGRGSDGTEGQQHAPAERSGGALEHAQGVGRGEGRPEPEVHGRGRDAAGRASGELGSSVSSGRDMANTGDGGRDEGRRGPAANDDRGGLAGLPQGGEPASRGEPLADTLGGDLGGRPGEPLWSEGGRAAVRWSIDGPLFIPGPGDVDAWRWIAQHYPERLPALSRYDLFVHALRTKGFGADGRAIEGPGLGEDTPAAVRAARIQEAAQSALRGRPDGVASRIDELRMLGNGVVDLEGAYAVRALVSELAGRSAGAALLVRMMGQT